ncbi:MAG TPA: spore coat associated protein CotJA [Lachnoclostridium phocaeense]|nr:spore coat associated protein CotJA [Lachnoclostridium phocaeense]
MAYVPWQEWCGILELEKGLCCGTIFEELNKPFTGAGGRR